ncbi:hypothetical protein FK531_01270 [Rhodococcus spelaei]|uniref:Uncharacterized protein n=1 Tax=Rhodococcus spelaei TaxID=2546320 RepID=A0A541BR06_9NOCA|nr:hypothetical protein [Rhodococcus spelaei]TQF74754.1 hypothetical protein FK531_01270 [Rhodococcus spelaei]
MVGKLVRAGGSVLAALTIVAGGAVVGMGTAGAQTGSADEVWRNLVSPCYDSDPFFPDQRPCYRNNFSDSGMLGNYKGAYFGAKTVDQGAHATFTAVVVAQEAAFQVAAPEVNVDVTSVTHRAPKGFEFVAVKVTGITPAPQPLGGQAVALDSTAVVDPVTGDVTVTAPAGGWALLPGRDGRQFAGGSVSLVFDYKAPDKDLGGDNGFTFTGTGVPASNGWVAQGNTRVVPVSGGIGSTGS